MKKLYLSIQGGWLTRVGHRGRFLTVYRYWYWGGENTERFHSHPWRFSVGVVLRGWIEEKFPEMPPVLRRPFSVSFNLGACAAEIDLLRKRIIGPYFPDLSANITTMRL